MLSFAPEVCLSSLVACYVPYFVYCELTSAQGNPRAALASPAYAGKLMPAQSAPILPDLSSCLLHSLFIKIGKPAGHYTIFLPPAEGGVGGWTFKPMGCTFTRGLPTEWMTGATAMSAGVTLTPSGLRMHTPGFRHHLHHCEPNGTPLLCSTCLHATRRRRDHGPQPAKHSPSWTPRDVCAEGSSRHRRTHSHSCLAPAIS